MSQTTRLNEKFIEIMEQLADIMVKKGEPFRAKAYQKAQETIMSYPTNIMTPNDLKGKPGIGSTIMAKLNEYVETGIVEMIEFEKKNPVNILCDVYGIGPKKSKELVEKGITSIEKLRENQEVLNDVQKVGLRYYEDILQRIPRSEIEKYKVIFNKASENANAKMEIVGSYRRGAQNSGDIDVIITPNTSSCNFTNFIDNLIQQKIIVHVLSRGPTKCLVIAKIPSSDYVRRVDFLYTTPEEFPFAILYFTGSKIFNTVMRHIALEKGYTMNEHGLCSLTGEKKTKVDHCFKTEKDIFDFLGLEYKCPVDRIDGRAVVLKGATEDEVEKFVKKEVVPAEILAIASNFTKNGISTLKKLNEAQLTSVICEANNAYYNEKQFLTDNQYDIIKEYIETRYPQNKIIHEIGAPVTNKVKLPYPMGSMNKIKPDTNALHKWMEKYKGPYVISCKLDGVSGLYTTEGGEPKLYTRGDGIMGQDKSNLIPYLRLPKTKGVVVRGEFIIPKHIFDVKYKTKFANSRNMISGIINHKTVPESIHDVHFVAYEVIKPEMKPSTQLELLSTFDIETVLWKSQSSISNNSLSQILVQWRESYPYEIDGIIVANDAIYERKVGCPDHAFAFKMVLTDQIAEAKVVDVIWTPSKDRYIKPRVQIEPIQLGGVEIEYATGFNAAFIYNNKIGIGSVIELIRSGDVIPHIRRVIVPADKAKMPTGSYKWNDTHVDIMLEDTEINETVQEKNITGFFKGIEVEGLSSGNISRMIHSGFDTVPKIIKMTMDDLLEVEGFKEKTATKLYNGIREKIDAASLVTIMSASNMFGRGFSEKRLELIMEAYPTILLVTESNDTKIEKISSIKGMATKSAEAFVERIPQFIQFIKEAGLVHKLISVKKTPPVINESHPLFGKTIVMTGFRDDVIINALKSVGAKLGSSVSSKTSIVLVKDITENTGKIIDAKKLGIPIMTTDMFHEKYKLK